MPQPTQNLIHANEKKDDMNYTCRPTPVHVSNALTSGSTISKSLEGAGSEASPAFS